MLQMLMWLLLMMAKKAHQQPLMLGSHPFLVMNCLTMNQKVLQRVHSKKAWSQNHIIKKKLQELWFQKMLQKMPSQSGS